MCLSVTRGKHEASNPIQIAINIDLNWQALDEESLEVKPPKCDPDKTMIVFDWDDTLLCSTYLSSRGFTIESDSKEVPAILREGLDELAAAIITVLQLALDTCEDVVIITNASQGWVHSSAEKFVPDVLWMLDHPRISVLSARSTFESVYPGSGRAWKLAAFRQEIARVFDNDIDSTHQVVSFGDSSHEREASQTAARDYGIRVKSVKFLKKPTIAQLYRQLITLQTFFDSISSHQSSLDLVFEE